MNKRYTVHIMDFSDGFQVELRDPVTGQVNKMVYIDQEETRGRLANVFRYMGYETHYEEVY